MYSKKFQILKLKKKFCEQVIHILIPSCDFYVLTTPMGNDWIYSLEYDVIRGFWMALMLMFIDFVGKPLNLLHLSYTKI